MSIWLINNSDQLTDLALITRAFERIRGNSFGLDVINSFSTGLHIITLALYA